MKQADFTGATYHYFSAYSYYFFCNFNNYVGFMNLLFLFYYY